MLWQSVRGQTSIERSAQSRPRRSALEGEEMALRQSVTRAEWPMRLISLRPAHREHCSALLAYRSGPRKWWKPKDRRLAISLLRWRANPCRTRTAEQARRPQSRR